LRGLGLGVGAAMLLLAGAALSSPLPPGHKATARPIAATTAVVTAATALAP
jgi:hypothetical protein